MMQTMEKSKVKKKKKTTAIARSSNSEETLDISNLLDNLPSTSDLDSLFYQECIVSQTDSEIIEDKASELKSSVTGIIADEVIPTENIEIDSSCNTAISNITLEPSAIDEKTIKTECNEIILTPSAPKIMDTNEVAQRMDFYPMLHKEQVNMEQVNYHTQKSIEKEASPYNILRNEIKVELDIQPFTKEQFTELYMNPLLTQVDHFEQEFINTELNNEASYSNHLLYELLLNYAKSRNHMRTNLIDYENYKKVCINNETILWKLEKHTVEFKALCVSDKSTKKVFESYEYAVYNNNAANNLALNLKDLTNTVYYSYTLNSFASEVNKLEIDEKIKNIINNNEFVNVQSASSISLETNIDENLHKPIGELRIAISILFYFLRQSLSDKVLCNDIKLWLEKLIAMHIRVATWQDHFFLLFHILRCPAGIGTWASQALQISNTDNKFSLKEINHAMAIITKLLLPVSKRDEFLKQNVIDTLPIPTNANSSNSSTDNWILVDSDGEDGHNSTGECVPLKESDLVALLNQIPLEKIFNYYTMTECQNGKYICKSDNITGYNLLTFIAFSTNLIEILSNGLETYKSERYKQFAKRLGRLIAHTVKYISDVHNIFKKNDAPKDLFLSARIQLEFDIFVMRASHCIYKSRCFGTWQYLTVLPFENVTMKTLGKLFYFLHVGYDDIIETINDDCIKKILDRPRFYAKFSDLCTELSAEDLYYLLQTFVNMVVVKEPEDQNFIRIVTLDLVAIGYINKTTKDICYKTARDLLANLMTKYPHLLLDILNIVNEQGEQIDPTIIYLYKSLPISLWIPTNDNFEIIATWLLNFSYESTQNTIARIILNKLNFNFDKNGKLFLPYEVHVRIACLIVKVANKHVPECIGLTGSVSKFVKDQSSKTQFSTWCWNMMSILRLHCMDQSKEVVYNTIQNPFEILKHIAEIEQLENVFEGVVESRPIALFASILASQWGHSIPQICHKGFMQLQQLLLDSRHTTVIRCIHLLTPLFINCPDSLSCEKFDSILSQLLSADRTYMKMAKEFISSDSYGPVVEMFCNMIQAQITDYISYGFSSPTPFIKMWLLCLTNNNNWFKDANVLYVIDVILRIAFQFPDAWMITRVHFSEIYQKIQASKITKSSFINFLGSSPYNEIVTFASTNAYWISFLTLEIEYEIVETKIWPEILRQIGSDAKQTSLDNIIKKSAVLISSQAFSTDSLTLYKWANLIISCPNNHPLLPIMAQKFFILYLGRIPYNTDEERFATTFGGAEKFYETNIKLMKKLKKRLMDAKDFYWNLVLKDPETIVSLINRHCSDFFNSCVLWLEETILSKIKGDMIELPVSYNVNKLQQIFTGHTEYWNEYINFPELISKHKDASKIWLKNCFRYYCSNQLNSSISKDTEDIYDPQDKIFQHLKSYDTPIQPWKVSHDMAFVEPLPSNLNNNVLKILRNNLKTVAEQAKNFNLKVKEINALDCNYKEWLTKIYETETVKLKRVVCNCRFCYKYYTAEQSVTRSFENRKIRTKIMMNRETYFEEIKKQLNKPSSSIVLSIVKIQNTIRLLRNEYMIAKESNNMKRLSIVSQLGVTYFYDLVNAINEQISIYPPSKELCYSLISQLGMFFEEKQCTEGLNLIKTALKKPKLVNILTELFVPSSTSPTHFIKMYDFIVQSNTNDQNSEILFVLLFKFDIHKWLTAFNPKLKEINNLINIILIGLEGWTNKNTISIQKIFRQHLIELFEYKFPEHCGEILQLVLTCTSDQKIDPNILLDVINSMYEMVNCEKINMKMLPTRLNEEYKNFAMKQKLFKYNELVEVAALLTRHYQNERLQHGLHGLYPKHKDYCHVISMLYGSIAHAIIVSAVHAYPGVLAEQLIEWLWPILRDLFGSWLVPYYMQNMKSAPATWIQQLSSNNPVLLPWTEVHTDEAHIFLNIFYDSIVLLLDMLPGCDTILANIFFWYESVYANNAIPRYIHTSIHNTLLSLPWNRFKPIPAHIDCINKIVQQFIPDSHMFVGHIFQRIPWTPWLQQNIHTWDYNLRIKTLASLLHIIVKLSYEPNIREGTAMNLILQEAKSYPWHIIEYQGVQSILDWFVMSTEPSTILKMPSEHLVIDNALIEFLGVVCAFTETLNPDILSTPEAQTKRILFVRTMLRLLRSCGAKHQQLLDTKEGKHAFYEAVTNLLNSCSLIMKKIKLAEEANHESINLVIELMSTIEKQSEYTSLLMAQSIIKWQSNCDIGCFILVSFINSFGVCKHVSNNLCLIMESTIFNYFKNNESTNDYHKPNWYDVVKRLGSTFASYDTHLLIKNNYILTLHMLSMHKLLTKLSTYGEKLTFLNSLLGFIVHCKIGEFEEPKIALIWGLIISNLEFNNCSIATNDFILILINYFNDLSNETESWHGSILGAIGLKKENISNKRKILTKILHCFLLSHIQADNLHASVAGANNLEESSRRKYYETVGEIKALINTKKLSDVRTSGEQSIKIIEGSDNIIINIRKNVYKIIKLFYSDNFLVSFE